MRKDERIKIEKAIRLLHTDDGFDQAMDILVRLAGRTDDADRIKKFLSNVGAVDPIALLRRRPNSSFKAPGQKKETR